MIKQIVLVNCLIIGLLGVSSIAIAYTIAIACTSNYNYILVCDPALSLKAVEEIALLLESQWPVYQRAPEKLWDVLQKQCPYLESCIIAYTPHTNALINIKAQKPLACINGQKIITEQGNLIAQNYTVEIELPNLIVEELSTENKDTELDPAFFRWLQSLTRDMHDQFEFCWNNKTYITLTEKNNPTTKIICRADQEIRKEIIDACMRVKASTKKGQNWQADIRFKDLIIVGEKG